MNEKFEKKFTKDEIKKATLEYFNGDELATDVWMKKYCLKDNDDFFELTPDDMHKRIAKELSRIEKKYPNPINENDIYDSLKNFKRIVKTSKQANKQTSLQIPKSIWRLVLF